MPIHVVLLPGFLGIDLVDSTGTRLWLDPATILAGQVDIAARLTLDPSGEHDATPGLDVRPEKPIGFIYDPLTVALGAAGLVVHTFLFDYRKPILAAARDLRAFIAREAPGERVWLVAHSIGGPLAALCPYLDPTTDPPAVDPSWQDHIAGVVCHGGTLLGTFEAVEALTGTHWFLAVVGLGNTARENALRRCLSTWPGLLALLPDPTRFPDVDRVYDASQWPAGYQPLQQHLADALRTKDLVGKSPLFTAPIPIAQFISSTYHTDGALDPSATPLRLAPRTSPGDDTVPVFAAAPNANVRVLRSGFPHTFIPTDPDVIRDTIDFIRTGTCAAPEIPPAGPDVTLPGNAPSPPIAMLFGMGGTLARELPGLVSGQRALRDLAHLFTGRAP
jgi:hypothetical protein